jgi:hypothetical protein
MRSVTVSARAGPAASTAPSAPDWPPRRARLPLPNTSPFARLPAVGAHCRRLRITGRERDVLGDPICDAVCGCATRAGASRCVTPVSESGAVPVRSIFSVHVWTARPQARADAEVLARRLHSRPHVYRTTAEAAAASSRDRPSTASGFARVRRPPAAALASAPSRLPLPRAVRDHVRRSAVPLKAVPRRLPRQW